MLSLSDYRRFAEDGYITQLTNTASDQFLFGDSDFRGWYDHTQAKDGDLFWDGNNGDLWKVYHVNLEGRRMVVENVSQRRGLYELMYW